MFDFLKRGKDNKSSTASDLGKNSEKNEKVDIAWDNLGFTNAGNKTVDSYGEKTVTKPQLFDLENEKLSQAVKEDTAGGNNDSYLGDTLKTLFGDQPEMLASIERSRQRSLNDKKWVVEEDRKEIEDANRYAIERRIEDIRKAYSEKYKEYVLPEVNEELNFVSGISSKNVIEDYKKPPMISLNRNKLTSAKEMKNISNNLLDYLKMNNIGATLEELEHTGNVYTFGLRLETGVRVSTLMKDKDGISVALGGPVEFEVPLHGTSLFGIHLMLENESVCIRQAIESKAFRECEARIPILLGVSDHGEMVVDDLDSLGHLLIGGTSGSGKSVLINTILMGLLYKTEPKDIRLILIDTSILNLSVYNGIPQLEIPVVTESKKALWTLNWCCAEIKNRNRKLTEARFKDIDDYNTEFPNNKLPHIVVIIDEFGPVIDEDGALESFQEICTLGKPAGVHLIIATQKINSKNVVRMLKDSVNARISLNVFSEAESKSFLGVSGAEKLKGQGDMLYRRPGTPDLVHLHGIDTKDEEAVSTVKNLIYFNNSYMMESSDVSDSGNHKPNGIGYDPWLFEAGLIIIEKDKASIGMIQREFKLGFNRAARIMDQLCELGVVGDEEGTKPRKVLMTTNQFCNAIEEII